MGLGGVETWLMHVLRHVDRRRVRMDFIVHSDAPGEYDEELRALGAKLHRLPFTEQPRRYAKEFISLVKRLGTPDIIHSHTHAYSGWILAAAARAGVGGRVAHAHSDRRHLAEDRRWQRRLYRTYMRRLLDCHATMGLACSAKAAEDLYGEDWKRNKRRRVLCYGIDLVPYEAATSSAATRNELGIQQATFVVGHVGRMTAAKNHFFLLDVFKALKEQHADSALVLVGDGELANAVRARANQLGISQHVRFLGNRRDVPRLMATFDVFAFPSTFEGLGIVLVEAQAAGIPSVISDAIPEEAAIVPDAISRLSLSSPLSTWVKTLLQYRTWKSHSRRLEMLATVKASSYGIQKCIDALLCHYEDSMARTTQFAEHDVSPNE